MKPVENSTTLPYIIVEIKNSDMDGKGTKCYSVYMHVSALSTMTVGKTVYKGDKIGKIETQANNGGYSPHLHFGFVNTSEAISSTTRYYPMGSFYNSVREWDYGARLDFIKPWINNKGFTDNVLYLKTYTSTSTTLAKDVTKVLLFYKVNNSATFTEKDITSSRTYSQLQAKDANGTQTTANTATYKFDFKTIAKTGDKVTWYLKVTNDASVTQNFTYFPYNSAISSHNYKEDVFTMK